MEAYRRLVERISTLGLNLQERVKRCRYLKAKMEFYKHSNPEQAEAYRVRFESHKPKLGALMERIQELENALKRMPKEWIV